MRVARQAALLLGFSVLFASGAQAQATGAAYPSRPLRLIVPFTTGQMVDVVVRGIAQELSGRLGQPAIVENRPGASEAIALELAAKAPADGHTAVVGSQSGLVLLPAARKKLPYDPVRDFAPVTMMFATQLFLVVHPSVPANSARELVGLARSRPGQLNYGSIGRGSGAHLLMEMFKTSAGVDIVHVPFTGNAQAQTGVLSGQVQVLFEGPSILTHVRAGRLRALASSGQVRAQAMPELPTLAEAGVPGVERLAWFGLAVPSDVPRPIVARLNAEVGEILRLASLRTKFALYNLEFMPGSPEQMAERIRAETPVWSKVMRSAGIEPE